VKSGSSALTRLFGAHPRAWQDFRYVYPVISRRSRGLSVGINLNPDKICNFNCVYCQVDRREMPPPAPVDFERLSAELEHLLADPGQVFDDPHFARTPPELRELRDIAFSGDGEPTASPAFPAAAGLAAELRQRYGHHAARIVVITNGTLLRRAAVVQTLAFLDQHHGQYWIKLDAGTQGYFQQVNRAAILLDELVGNIVTTARVRPVVIQSLFMRLHDQPPPPAEIDAYLERLHSVQDQGGEIELVQVYTVARQTAEPFVRPLGADELEAIAAGVRALGLPVETYA